MFRTTKYYQFLCLKNKIEFTDIKGYLSFLKDFKIVFVRNTEAEWNFRLLKTMYKDLKPEFYIGLEPHITSSWLDENAIISRDYWALTLICTNGSGCDGNHAAIVIEGLKKDYFMQLAHLTLNKSKTDRKVDLVDILNPPLNLKYTGRSQVWLRNKDLVKNMLKEIEKNKKSPPKLNWKGSDSIFAENGVESCFTWARKKLKIAQIELGTSYLDWLASITTRYTPIKPSFNLKIENIGGDFVYKYS